jgi:hypothetical protein
MDNVVMNADFPQEDSYALGAFSPYSYYHGWCFPKNMEFYNNYVCMDTVPQKTIDEWKRYYLYLLKKITYHQQGKQLLLKNQDNTGKIKILLEMFPMAKFIYLYRNPYDLYFSMMKFMKTAIPRYCIQKPPRIEIIEQSMMNLYVRMIQKYIIERESIPRGNLIGIPYETFNGKPLEELQKIYETLRLEGFQKIKPAFHAYIQTQKNIQTDSYTLTTDIKRKIEEKWGFAIKAFGY